MDMRFIRTEISKRKFDNKWVLWAYVPHPEDMYNPSPDYKYSPSVWVPYAVYDTMEAAKSKMVNMRKGRG